MVPERALALKAATPMIHVPDVRATASWYETIGFTVLETCMWMPTRSTRSSRPSGTR
jgi:hypothetical protein